jgi:division protein CdvB (Snf7/Vps24/ESCRT-III family)
MGGSLESKFLLKSTIEQFDRRISGRLKEEEGKLFEAKKYVESDQTRAKKILREVREMKKVTEEFENRRRLLR